MTPCQETKNSNGCKLQEAVRCRIPSKFVDSATALVPAALKDNSAGSTIYSVKRIGYRVCFKSEVAIGSERPTDEDRNALRSKQLCKKHITVLAILAQVAKKMADEISPRSDSLRSQRSPRLQQGQLAHCNSLLFAYSKTNLRLSPCQHGFKHPTFFFRDVVPQAMLEACTFVTQGVDCEVA
jgi:hypothetical protein